MVSRAADAEPRTAAEPTKDGFPVRFPRERKLLEGRLVRRYKRFLADVELVGRGGTGQDGSGVAAEVVTAHCANTGAMEGLILPGSRVWVARAENPDRKLAWDWELAEGHPLCGGRVFGAHTGVPNRLVRRLLEGGHLPWLGPVEELAPERRYGERSRIDFWLRGAGRETYLEVKNCHLVYPDGHAYFPDAVSERAAKHLEELAAVVERGDRAEVLFVCQTGPVEAIRPSDVHDPRFAETARRVADVGVGFSAIVVTNRVDEVVVEGRVPVDLEPYPTAEIEAWKRVLRGEG